MRVAIHTAATRDYLPGLKALVYSIRRQSQSIDIYVTTDMDAAEFPQGCNKLHLAPILSELQPWGMAAYVNGIALDCDRVILMGADQIIVGDLEKITDGKWGDFAAIDGWGSGVYKDAFPYFATGTLIVKPYAGLLAEFVGVARECWSEPNPYGYITHDEHTWNEWAYRKGIKPTRIPHYYDCSRRVFEQNKSQWAEWRDKVVSLHYLGHPKPWVGGTDIMTKLWRSYYEQNPMGLP